MFYIIFIASIWNSKQKKGIKILHLLAPGPLIWTWTVPFHRLAKWRREHFSESFLSLSTLLYVASVIQGMHQSWRSCWSRHWLARVWQKTIRSHLPKLSGVLELWLALAGTWLRCSCSHVWNSEAQMKDTLKTLQQHCSKWKRAESVLSSPPNLEEFLDVSLLLRNPWRRSTEDQN